MKDDEYEPTAPDSDTCEPGLSDLLPTHLGLVLLWSDGDPDRVGQVALLEGKDWWEVGRRETERSLGFRPQRPGVPYDTKLRCRPLGGSRLSGSHLRFRVQGDFVEMERIADRLTLVNGRAVRGMVRLSVGDLVLARGAALFRVVQRPMLIEAVPGYEDHVFGDADRFGIVGESPAIWALRRALASAAKSPFHVLLIGPTGAGKELSAATIAGLSGRRLPHVSTTVAGVSEKLIESILFGNIVNYPYPGPARKCLFATADKGVLFLDEIGECSPELQAALLRVLDEGLFKTLGESVERQCDVKVVAATNHPEKLRPELLLRFKKQIHIPSLSDRREDIPLLLRHLSCRRAVADEAGAAFMRPFLLTGPTGRIDVDMSGRVVDHLVRAPLTGNMRELEQLFDSLISESRGKQIRLPKEDPAEPESEGAASPVSGSPASNQPTEKQVRAALRKAKGNVRQAAVALDRHFQDLYVLIKGYGIDRDNP
jgi:two-component system nitrogen regulation response regulator GlnG/two-component system response regulator HydG